MRCTCDLFRAAIGVVVSLGSMTAFAAPWQHKASPEAPTQGAAGKEIADPSKTIALSAATDLVNSKVTVDAALLPYSVSRRIFGTEIAKHYAIVQLVISNHDSGDAMIVQSVLLDYRHWLFSGNFAALGLTPQIAEGLTPQQTSNTPFQVASTESRLVRAELQDAQQWTARNWTVRSAVLIGATAVAYQFPFGQAFAQGSNAFSGVLVPGLEAVWPDNVQTQINHISDFGFGTNHVIPKNSSDVVVAFFPLDRFLTPDLQDIFRKAPSAYFNPSEMLIDKTYRVKLLDLLRRAGALGSENAQQKDGSVKTGRKQRKKDRENEDDKDVRTIASAIQHYEQFRLAHAFRMPGLSEVAAENTRKRDLAIACGAISPTSTDVSAADGQPPSNSKPGTDVSKPPVTLTPPDCLLLTLLNGVSLNNIRVIASGIMTVDTSRVPATLTGVKFESDTNVAETWAATTKEQTATLAGTFLSGGQPVITALGTDDKPLKEPVLGEVTVNTLKSDDNKLVFTYTVPAKIDPKTALSFRVSKTSKDGSETESAPLPFPVPGYKDDDAKEKKPETAPSPEAAKPAGAKPVTNGPGAHPAAGAASSPSHPAPAGTAPKRKRRSRQGVR